MKPEIIIVRYSEIGLKAKKTRRYFENVLIKNMKKALKTEKIQHEITKEWGRIYVQTPKTKEGMNVLKKITGIVSVSPAFKTKSNIKSILKETIKISENLTNHKSFALRVKRTGEHSFTSQEIAIKIGQEIVDKTKAKVDLTKPDFEIFIDIRQNNTYIYTEKISCIGGLPYGTQGNVISIIEDIDSILAAWYLMKRGCKIYFLIKNKEICEKVKSFTKKWYIDFKQIDDKNFNIQNFNSIIIGDYLSDEIDIISKIKNLKEKYSLPIITPLISFEKEDIDKKSKKIGLTL